MDLKIGDRVIYNCNISGKQFGKIRDIGLVGSNPKVQKKTYQIYLDNGNIVELLDTELLEKPEDNKLEIVE